MTVVTGISNMKLALMIFRGSEKYPTLETLVPPSSAIIDVWWILHDGLLLLLPYILAKNSAWGKGGATLRIFAVKTSCTDNPILIEKAVVQHLKKVRIQASVKVVDLSRTSIADDMRSSHFQQEHYSSTHAKTLGEVFNEVSTEIPYVSLSQITETMDIESGDVYDESKRQTMSRLTRERLDNAKAFNTQLRLHSSMSNLIVTNLPNAIESQHPNHFFEYIDNMCEGCENVLLIRGSGKEIITTYA